MQSLPEGYWNYEIGQAAERPTLRGLERADVLIIGGGLSALWTARNLLLLRPGLKIIILEKEFIGFGPSGRSGGIVYDWWTSLPRLQRMLGNEQGLRIARFSEECIRDLQELPGTDYQQGGVLHISTSPLFDNASACTIQALQTAGRADLFQVLGPEEVSERIVSPRFRGGIFYPRVGAVHPAKLVRSLLQTVEAGAQIYERSEVLRVERSGSDWVAHTDSGRVRAPLLLQATGAEGALRSKRVISSSSHMIVTEPLDDIKDYWPSPLAATDERATVRYFRKTDDDRIAFGWGFGRANPRQDLRRGERGSEELVREVFRSFFPHWHDRQIEFSWGGPIDISPTHLPLLRGIAPGRWSVAGYTGNGIGATCTMGRIMALQLLGEPLHLHLPRPALSLPPEPLRSWAGDITRAALLRKEASMERGRKPRPLTRFVADLPGRLGIELGR